VGQSREFLTYKDGAELNAGAPEPINFGEMRWKFQNWTKKIMVVIAE